MDNLILNLKIYSLKTIDHTIQIFSEFVFIHLKQISGEKVQLIFQCEDSDKKFYQDEFCNYLIYLMGK
ncbi:MAG: HxsD-like protein [Halanaerobiales bacterium]|nr:HxsD-like protein [Halanaerobiales bacterium]